MVTLQINGGLPCKIKCHHIPESLFTQSNWAVAMHSARS